MTASKQKTFLVATYKSHPFGETYRRNLPLLRVRLHLLLAPRTSRPDGLEPIPSLLPERLEASQRFTAGGSERVPRALGPGRKLGPGGFDRGLDGFGDRGDLGKVGGCF
jgi:hypothetical protein